MNRDKLELERLRSYLGDYLRQRGLSTRKPFRCLSPSHVDKHPSMSYNQKAANVHCFACGVTYDLFDLVGMDYGMVGFTEQYKQADALFGIGQGTTKVENQSINLSNRLINSSNIHLVNRPAELLELRNTANKQCHYLISRGIMEESCARYGLFEWEGRAYFPLMEQGSCTGWCARAIDDEVKPRYKNSGGSIGLWCVDHLGEDGKGRRLFITEGVVDAICLEQQGECAVALCGSQNAAKLLRICDAMPQTAGSWQFVLCGDPDAAGQKMNKVLADGLKEREIAAVVLGLEPSDEDVGALYVQNQARLCVLLEKLKTLGQQESNAYDEGSTAALLGSFFIERERRAGRQGLTTGLPQLDKLLDGGLYPGLYVLGAISSLGKTSLALQIADHIAEHEGDVLYITLEQSRYELMAKSLSRTTAALDQRNAFTARQLLSGHPSESLDRTRQLQDAADVYAKAAASLFIREGVADIGVAEIRQMMDTHKKNRGQAPVVFVDYLQILRPVDSRATDKQSTDRAVVELKRLSRDFDIPVVAISSFNRENYRAAVSMEAFKESGAVEYSADVLLGLQLLGAGERDFDVNAAKLEDPRQVELVMLKNRNGIPYAKVPLAYNAKFSLFTQAPQVQVRGISQAALQAQFGLAKLGTR